MQSDLSDCDDAGRKIHVFCARFFRTPKQALVKHLILQCKHGTTPVAGISVSLNGVQNVLVKVRIVRNCTVVTVPAPSAVHPIVDAFAVASFQTAQVVSHWIEA
jgi:hypothetical protein